MHDQAAFVRKIAQALDVLWGLNYAAAGVVRVFDFDQARDGLVNIVSANGGFHFFQRQRTIGLLLELAGMYPAQAGNPPAFM